MWLLRRTGPWWNESTGTVIAQFREIASISNCVVTNRLLYTLNFHQENVEMSIKTNNKGEIEHRLVGFVQLGTLHDDMRKWEGNNIFRKNRHRDSFSCVKVYASQRQWIHVSCSTVSKSWPYSNRPLWHVWKGVQMMVENNLTCVIYFCTVSTCVEVQKVAFVYCINITEQYCILNIKV